MSEWRIFWGEAHDNTFQYAEPKWPFEENLRNAASHLDFYAAAYYTACATAFTEAGHVSETPDRRRIVLEGWKPPERIAREWAELQEGTRAANRPGEFVTFPGYEWQGDGTSGDHNVFAREEGLPIFRVNTLGELYAALRGREAIAIPHHTAYRPGRRGRDWSVYDETISPFAELYSLHGCSETDEEWIGLRHNPNMGPGQGGGTYQDALDRGYHLGCICSNDNWRRLPGAYGRGLMACLAEDLTREALWRAFRARRVYGVTGDRIRLDFRVNGAPMGSIIPHSARREIRVRVVGADALDRIELMRNGRVIATHCHQGTWDFPRPGQRTRFVLRVEAGWGARTVELDTGERRWEGLLAVEGGRMLGFQPCWITPGQGRPVLERDAARFTMLTSPETRSERAQNANVFEFEAAPESRVLLRMNGLEERATLAELARGSRTLWFREECIRLLHERLGLAPGTAEREDVVWYLAHKVKVHRPMPEAAYSAQWTFEDDTPLDRETHYRVRVEQRNGQRAWGSPIWVRPPGAPAV